eukprot:IDg19341t1
MFLASAKNAAVRSVESAVEFCALVDRNARK